jgi:hypothetical protein
LIERANSVLSPPRNIARETSPLDTSGWISNPKAWKLLSMTTRLNTQHAEYSKALSTGSPGHTSSFAGHYRPRLIDVRKHHAAFILDWDPLHTESSGLRRYSWPTELPEHLDHQRDKILGPNTYFRDFAVLAVDPQLQLQSCWETLLKYVVQQANEVGLAAMGGGYAGRREVVQGNEIQSKAISQRVEETEC